MSKTIKLTFSRPFEKKSVETARLKWAGLIVPLLAGLLFWGTRLGVSVDNLSYDLLFLFKPRVQPTNEVVIIYMDEESRRELGQAPVHLWDRALHARLLEHLTTDEAKLVVFDVVFDGPGSSVEADQALQKAIEQNGRVVLAATFLDEPAQVGLEPEEEAVKSLEGFQEVASNWGFAKLAGERGTIHRQVYQNTKWGVSLPWAGAIAAGPKPSSRYSEDWWLNFYGPRNTIKSIPYCRVTNQLEGFFRNKVVFIGSRPGPLDASFQTEEVQTPYSRWGEARILGVEVLATGYLNLAHGDALTRFSRLTELCLVIVCGLLLGWGFGRLRLLSGLVVAVGGFLVLFAVALILHWNLHMWFSWLMVAGVQIPCALAWKAGVSFSKPQPVAELSDFLTFDGKRRIPNIPDHTLLKRIGKGGYGEVWLARNTIGMFRAVKFIFRDRYSTPDPYQRELSGIEKFMPISLNHPWLVHVLHVGKNDSSGQFFYIMEAADDEVSGQKIDPETYVPKNLSGELGNRGRIPVEECVSLGLQLATALDFIHKSGLIHRDIKPANIIFVNSIPKLADIGLVTEIANEGRILTYVGTEGYIPPEGPGSAAGDVYSLGKVIYEICMGRDRKQYPDLPTSVVEGSANPALYELNEIILKACESDVKQRYQSADEVYVDLLRLQERLQSSRPASS